MVRYVKPVSPKKTRSSSEKGIVGAGMHKIKAGLSGDQPDVQDPSRKIQSTLSVNDGAIRSGVGVGKAESGKDTGILK